MKLNGAEIIIKILENKGIDTIAGIPGGANLPLYDALYKSKIKHILARHEQGAGFIAHGMSRSTGKPAVCFATSGPGATNLLTAIADAKLDSIPVIAITGQVPTGFIGTDAFQEVDTYGMTLPVTKHNFLVKSAKELLGVLPKAFEIATSGRPGPVLIDVPKDVQKEIINVNVSDFKNTKTRVKNNIDKDKIKEIAEVINKSKKPVMYIGGGVISADAGYEVFNIAKKNNIPVTSTLMALGAFPSDDHLYLGMLGMHGARYTNYIIDQADIIMAFGARFDDRATGKVKDFCRNAKIIHIDIDKSEINKIKNADYSISGDISKVLKALEPFIHKDSREEWISDIEKIKNEFPFEMPDSEDNMHPLNIITEISGMIPSDSIITTDVGQHQMWVAQAYPFMHPRTLLTSGGLGTMGFGLPAAIGASLANPEKTVVCFSGDGSILMNIQELATLAELGLNVKVIIFNNNHLGLVRQQQELFYENNLIASKFDHNTNFSEIGLSFGIKSYSVLNNSKINTILNNAFDNNGPIIIDIPVDYTHKVFPMVPPGAANINMIGVVKD